jgi:hypothetical protein
VDEAVALDPDELVHAVADLHHFETKLSRDSVLVRILSEHFRS